MVFLTYSKIQDGQYFVHKVDSLCNTLYGPYTHLNPHMNEFFPIFRCHI